MDCCCAADVKVKFDGAKWFYFGLYTFSAIVTWILRDYADDVLDWVPEMDSCKSDDDDINRNACFGKGAVLRMSFALTTFHLIHMLFLIECKETSDPRTALHTDCLEIRLLVYGDLARICSGFFLVFQALVIINFVYVINERMIDREECIFPLVSGSLSSFGLSLALIIVGYIYYAEDADCGVNIFWITWTLIMTIFVTLISISKWRIENAGLFTSGAISAYCSFLLLSALTSEPHNSCIRDSGIRSGWIQVISFLLALAAVLASTMSIGTADISLESNGEPLPYRPDYFHLIFAVAAMYVAMLFTNWDLDDVPGEFDIDKGWRSAWIKIGSQWFVFLLYTWTLVAPKLFPDRDFS